MKPFPHQYRVRASASEQSSIELSAPGLTPMVSAAPLEFDGPGDLWSPETLLMAAVADCFVLTFRAIAKASGLRWTNVSCNGSGTVERNEGVTRFTAINLDIRLVVPAAIDVEKAKKVVEKAERSCVISNSLKTSPAFRSEVAVSEDVLVA
jgi:peroxiredoxin-like protein